VDQWQISSTSFFWEGSESESGGSVAANQASQTTYNVGAASLELGSAEAIAEDKMVALPNKYAALYFVALMSENDS